MGTCQDGTEPSKPLLVTIKEAARLMGLPRIEVYLLTKTGLLPRVRIGSGFYVRVPMVAIEQWLAERPEGTDLHTQ